jgi:glucose-6-phosphate 1-dehydrogenase
VASGVDSLVIFGATGDLAKLETFPALVSLVDRGVVDVPVVGVGRSGWGIDDFRDYAKASLRLNGMDPTGPAESKMLRLLRYVDGDLYDQVTYVAMSREMGEGSRALFYLEVPPPLFGRIAEGIAGVSRERDARVMVEKPFGTDLASARALDATLHQVFAEDAIFRVDHWLGLETLNNMLVVRFANSVIEPLLNRDHVQSIQITMAEAFDVADRGRFYDRTGAIRDVLQNHLLQVLASVLAEPPDGSGLDSWLSNKARVIDALRPLTPDDVVKGQYADYQEVDGVETGSTTETYVAARTVLNSWRWAEVPITIRAGKALPVTATEVVVRFRGAPYNVFGLDIGATNQLRFRIWPHAETGLRLAGKEPGAGRRPQLQELSFSRQPGMDQRPYDRLIAAALEGNPLPFARQDAVEAAWRIVDKVLGEVGPVHFYDRGSWGPAQADALLPEGDTWHDPLG